VLSLFSFCFCCVAVSRFVNNSAKMSFADFLSVHSVYHAQHPDAVWFHCNQLPDATDFYWSQLWKSVPLTVIYHNQQTSKHGSGLSGLNPSLDSVVVTTLLDHGGIYVDWNILVMQSLNPIRNHSTCFGKVSLHFTVCFVMPLTLF